MSLVGIYDPVDSNPEDRKVRRMPRQKPGTSIQEVATPADFLSAVKRCLNISEFIMDLAADAHNTVAADYLTEQDNSLEQPWPKHGWCWLNPPFSKLEKWVEKAWIESREGAQIAMLVPASVGSNWWSYWVDNNAYITFLNGRITFVGHTAPYPKDLALLLWAPYLRGGSCIWRWK
jgi:phage N-6-adenine-methyltransferase